MSDTEVESFRNRIAGSSAQIDCFITDGTDAEAHFLKLEHLREVFTDVDDETIGAVLENAKNETLDFSKKKIINHWITREERKRNLGKVGSVNKGELALAAQSEFDSNPDRYLHGKELLKVFHTLIKEESKVANKATVFSNALSHPALVTLAGEITNAPGPGENS